jgi:hypothetical protein
MGGADEADQVSPLPGAGGRRRTKKWIQKVVSKMNKGAFTRQALRHHELPLEYMADVLRHPSEHRLRTRRRATLLKNLDKARRRKSRSRK